MRPIPGAAPALRRLGSEGIRIRVITHRLFIRYFHEVAVQQTVRWLDHWSVPYWDLCFMREKGEVGAELYLEDSVENIKDLRSRGKKVLIMSNATNLDIADEPGGRATSWHEAESAIRDRYYDWLDERGLAKPSAPGTEPEWAKTGPRPAV